MIGAAFSFYDEFTGASLGDQVPAAYAYIEYAVGAHEQIRGTVTGELVPVVMAAVKSGGNVRADLFIGNILKGSCMLATPHWDAQRPGELHIDEPGLGKVLEGALIDRLTIYNGVLADLLSGIENVSVGLPALGGVQDLQFAIDVAGGALGLPVSEDMDTISVWRAIELLSRLLGGQLQPDAAQFWAESATRIVHLGKVGGAGANGPLHFHNGPGAPTASVPAENTIVVEPSLDGMASQISILGGPSDHGLPQGSRFTGLEAIVNAGAGSIASTFVASIYAGSTLGGVYYMADDLIFHPLSQNMGVTSLYHDTPRDKLYAATDRGVYETDAAVGPHIWKQTGGATSNSGPGNHPTFSAKCDQVSVDGTQVYIVSSGNNAGLNGLLTYPAVGGAVVTGAGYDYWSMLASMDIITGTGVDGTVYMVDANNPTRVICRQGLFSGTVTSTPIPIPGNYAVTKLVRVIYGGGTHTTGGGGGGIGTPLGGVFVLTAGGTDAFYFIDVPSRPLQLLPGAGRGGLPDGAINNVQFGGGTGPALLCSTSNGLYVSSAGGFIGQIETVRWIPIGTQGGLLGRSIEFAANGANEANQMAAATSGAFYDSNSAGEFWRDVLSARVDPLHALQMGSSGPWQVYRDGQRNYVARLTQTSAPYAPGAAAVGVDLPEVKADANVTPEDASAALVEAAERYLAYVSTPLTTVTVDSFYTDSGSPLDTARPTHDVTFTADRAPCEGDPGLHLALTGYIRSHSIEVDAKKGPTAWTKTAIGSSLVQQKLSIQELAGDILYRHSRLAKKV